MDILTLIAEILKACAWPVTTLLIIFLLKTELRQIIPKIHRIKFKDIEIEINEMYSEAQKVLPLKTEVKYLESGKEDLETRLERLSEISQRAAITEAWLELENVAVKAINTRMKTRGIWDSKNSGKIEEMLINTGLLNKEAKGLYSSLRRIRNQAAHESTFEIREKAVIEYIKLILKWIKVLEAEINTTENS
jgi:hypothetical protein